VLVPLREQGAFTEPGRCGDDAEGEFARAFKPFQQRMPGGRHDLLTRRSEFADDNPVIMGEWNAA